MRFPIPLKRLSIPSEPVDWIVFDKVRDIFPENISPTLSHKFFTLLHNKVGESIIITFIIIIP